ncbi:Alpha/Beta hydrolase protein [Mycena leptocephala]|nr:Alpha/Beta hydrolase protein [Mycena leptocephala]
MALNLSRYVACSLLVPAALVASYVLASSPIVFNQIPSPVDPGLASLPLNSPARAVYSEDFMEGGAYAQLPMGRVRYWLVGPTSGKKIVLIHGISIPALAFARLAPILAAAGYRVLLYDLYGRGYSDAPKGTAYDAQLYVTQLALLLQHLHWTRTRVVGFSMGGAIAAAFVAAFPGLVERDVVLIASAGASQVRPHVVYMHYPRVLMYINVGPYTVREISIHISISSPVQWLKQIQIVRLQAAHLPGYPHAVFASLHDGVINNMRWAFTAPTWRGRRVLLLNVCLCLDYIFLAPADVDWKGELDVIIPPVAAQALRRMLESAGTDPTLAKEDTEPLPDVSLIPVPGAGHDLTWTHTEEVARAVLEFFDAGGMPGAVARGPRVYESRDDE